MRHALAILASLAGVGCASAVRLPVCTAPPGARCIAANPDYAAGPTYRMLFGSGYRDVWTTPAAVPLLDLATAAGGLRPVKRVGSLQSQGLALAGADGRAYTFRSTDKDNARVLSGALEAVPGVSSAYRDQASSAHPGAPMVVAPLARAAGILQPSPRLVWIPDDPRLAEFREDFGERLGTFEEYPKPAADGRPGTFGAREIVDSKELWLRLDRDPTERVDARAYLRARLFDLVIGDVDRHPGQWRWARFEPGGAWQPIAEDRDFAFSRFGGLAIAAARPFRPLLGYFDDEFQLSALLRQAVGTDPRLLAELSREDWHTEVTELQRRITNEVIAEAVGHLPDTWRALTGTELELLLRKRMAALGAAAAAFYVHEACNVEIHATAADDVVTIEPIGPDAALIRVTAAGLPTPRFERRFLRAETRNIRLCGFAARDRVSEVETAIGVERHERCEQEREIGASGHDASSGEGSPDGDD